jgi:O-antigen ligase
MKIDYQKTLNYLFVAFAFVLPITSAGVSVIAGLMLLVWLAERDFSRKFTEIKSNPVALAVLGFIALHIVGLSWVDVQPINSFKSSLLLLIPIVMTSIKKEFIPKIFASFIAAMTISEILVYKNIFINFDRFGSIDPSDFMPFLSHITYNPFLAISISLLIVMLINKGVNTKYRYVALFFLVSMILNMFLTGGRAGQVALLVCLVILISYYFWHKKILFFGFVAAIPILVSIMYFANPVFQNRVNQAVSDIVNFNKNQDTSVGQRLQWTSNSIELIKEKPLFGHGTGSFEKDYERIHKQLTPNFVLASNPHNNYILVLVQFGIVGLLIFLSIFYTQIKSFMNTPKTFEYKPLKLILPIMFMVICLSDTYLWGHHTQALFALFSGILYSDRVS